MKKILALLMAILMLFVVCACVDSTSTNGSLITENDSSFSDFGNSETKTENTSCAHTKTSVKNQLSATCTEKGYSGDTYCNSCNMVIATGFELKAVGHNTEVRNKKSATYTSTGYTGDTYCKTCGIKTQSGQTIPKLQNNTQQATNSGTVYITETGKKYHSTKYCSGLNNAKAIYDSTLAKAQGKGLTPCSKCY